MGESAELTATSQGHALNPPSGDDIRRLEQKVDKLTDAVMRLVLLEERQTNQSERIATLEANASTTGESLRKVDSKVERWINRGIGAWAVAALVFAILQFGAKLLGG